MYDCLDLVVCGVIVLYVLVDLDFVWSYMLEWDVFDLKKFMW